MIKDMTLRCIYNVYTSLDPLTEVSSMICNTRRHLIAIQYFGSPRPLEAVRAAFVSDMEFLRSQQWLGPQALFMPELRLDPESRALHLSFLLYNSNFDQFISNRCLVSVEKHLVLSCFICEVCGGDDSVRCCAADFACWHFPASHPSQLAASSMFPHAVSEAWYRRV